jgi:hypothetical protein
LVLIAPIGSAGRGEETGFISAGMGLSPT